MLDLTHPQTQHSPRLTIIRAMRVETKTIPNATLGAFCEENHVALMHTSRGVLDGLTFATKDVFHIAGSRTGFGNPDWIRTHSAEKTTAPVVKSLLDAGADMLGRTLTDELAYSLSGENFHYGTPINSAAPDRIPGGSSNGSAAAVSGQVVDFALGTDCGGSVRLPAIYCGIMGIRPTHNRITTDGVIPFAPSFDVIGWFASDATIFEEVGSVLLDQPAMSLDVKRLIIAKDTFSLVDSSVNEVLKPIIKSLVDKFELTKEINVSQDRLAHWFEIFRTIQGSEIWANRKQWIKEFHPVFGPGIRERLEWASTIDSQTISWAHSEYVEINNYLTNLLEPDEILCLPTSPRVAPLRGTETNTLEIVYRTQAMNLLCIAGLGGLPQISLPLVTQGGLPLGLSFIGAPGSDMNLLALAVNLVSQPSF